MEESQGAGLDSETCLTPHPNRLDGDGYVTVGASAASFPNSSGVNARTVVVRAFPDDVMATANLVIASPLGISTTRTTSYLTGGDIATNQSSAEFGDQS